MAWHGSTAASQTKKSPSSDSVGSFCLAGVCSNNSLCLLPNRYLCTALPIRTCTRGNVYAMSARAYAEDEFVSLSLWDLGHLTLLFSCCLSDFLTVWGAMYPAVPPWHTNTPPWPKQGKGQHRACSQDGSHYSAKVLLSPQRRSQSQTAKRNSRMLTFSRRCLLPPLAGTQHSEQKDQDLFAAKKKLFIHTVSWTDLYKSMRGKHQVHKRPLTEKT